MEQDARSRRTSQAALTLAALGIVFGDIGTSPLYAVKETFSPAYGIPFTQGNIMGGLSTIFWALMIVISLKYVVLVMRADNRGEGGTMALLALASSAVKQHPRTRQFVIRLGLLGGALFYGETVLTPAISVVSAVEGLSVGTELLQPWVLPLAIGIVAGLFWMQSLGTAAVGRYFGPICTVWFATLAAVGAWNIVQNPAVLAALDPRYAADFVARHGVLSFGIFGAILLAITGAESLYADLGHFGKWPIRIAWFSIVLPALVLNYFGQGAVLIATPDAIRNPFYLAFPEWALYPVVALATAATVVASQATITGAFSLTRQAVQLGYLPRMNVVQTSAKMYGQVYVPAVNWILFALVLAALLFFGSSSNLAHAYGVALSGTMMVTTILTFFVVRFAWGFPLALVVLATAFFLVIDFVFFASTMLKVPNGGWFPLVLAGIIFTAMLTWKRGREILTTRLKQDSVPLRPFLEALFKHPPERVPGTAVFLTAEPDATPHALMHNLNHNKVLHESVVFLTVEVRDVPWVTFSERVRLERLGHDCWRVRVRYGFMNRPDVTRALELCGAMGLDFNLMETSFFLSRQKIVPVHGAQNGHGMALWRERLFAAMARNAGNVTDYFNIPTNRVIELGSRIEI